MDQNSKSQNISISNGTIIRVILFGVFFFALIKLANIILILLTSIVIASFIGFAVKKMKKYVKNRTLAVFLIYFCSFAAIVGLLSVFVPVFISEMSALVAQLGKYIPEGSILNSFQADTITGAQGVVTTISHNASLVDVIKSTQGLVSSLSGGFFSIFGQAFGGVFNLLLIIVVSFYLSVTENGVQNFLRIITPATHEEYIIGLWQRTEHKIGLWMQGQLLLGFIVGVLVFLGLNVLGVRYSLFLAVLAAMMEIIPLFGPILAAAPAILIGFMGSATLGIMVAGFYVIIQQFENHLIYPLVVRKVVGVSPIVVILALVIGGKLAGFLGLLLAVPLATALLELL
ncbi:MAG: AI-2E family transporter, partial [Patescibacteria group bacterium]